MANNYNRLSHRNVSEFLEEIMLNVVLTAVLTLGVCALYRGYVIAKMEKFCLNPFYYLGNRYEEMGTFEDTLPKYHEAKLWQTEREQFEKLYNWAQFVREACSNEASKLFPWHRTRIMLEIKGELDVKREEFCRITSHVHKLERKRKEALEHIDYACDYLKHLLWHTDTPTTETLTSLKEDLRNLIARSSSEKHWETFEQETATFEENLRALCRRTGEN